MNIKDKWVIEDVYSSDDCRHVFIGSSTGKDEIYSCWYNRDNIILCTKQNCPLKLGEGE